MRQLAEARGVSVAQLAIAWVASQGVDIVPVIGARRRDRLNEALGALKVQLTDADLAEIVAAIPKDAAAGPRYPAPQMAHLDSEQ
jgi:aryl-alcohol dehydrogenase-like predicted oxidoreductase